MMSFAGSETVVTFSYFNGLDLAIGVLLSGS